MAYGEIYNTTWWGNALDTARTAGTEPDFFGSQMKLLTSEQDSIVTNGDFATDTWWLKSSANVNISNGKGNYTAGTTEYFYKPNILTIGKQYKLVFEITDYTTGYLSALAGNWSEIQTSVGTYEIYFTCIDDDFGLVGNTFRGSIDNVSVQVARLELDQIEAKKCLADWIHTTALQDLNN